MSRPSSRSHVRAPIASRSQSRSPSPIAGIRGSLIYKVSQLRPSLSAFYNGKSTPADDFAIDYIQTEDGRFWKVSGIGNKQESVYLTKEQDLAPTTTIFSSLAAAPEHNKAVELHLIPTKNYSSPAQLDSYRASPSIVTKDKGLPWHWVEVCKIPAITSINNTNAVMRFSDGKQATESVRLNDNAAPEVQQGAAVYR